MNKLQCTHMMENDKVMKKKGEAYYVPICENLQSILIRGKKGCRTVRIIGFHLAGDNKSVCICIYIYKQGLYLWKNIPETKTSGCFWGQEPGIRGQEQMGDFGRVGTQELCLKKELPTLGPSPPGQVCARCWAWRGSRAHPALFKVLTLPMT